MLQNDIDNFPIEQPIQLDESGLDEAIEILDNAQEHLNQNFEQALIDQNHDDYDSESSFENPTSNIWHYYKFLTATPVIDGTKLILMIRTPLLDTDSAMTLYKIYNLPIYNPTIGKSLSYDLEGSNLAITKDNSYVTILTEAEFIQCTLAQGHFCSLNTALYHIDYSRWCLVAMFLKQNNRINKDCQLTITNITGPQAIYLDQGLWAISVDKPGD